MKSGEVETLMQNHTASGKAGISLPLSCDPSPQGLYLDISPTFAGVTGLLGNWNVLFDCLEKIIIK
jgi:hypothetical protein